MQVEAVLVVTEPQITFIPMELILYISTHCSECTLVSLAHTNSVFKHLLPKENRNKKKFLGRCAKERAPMGLLKWGYDNGCLTLDARIFYKFAEIGDLSALKWLYGLGCPYDSSAVTRACGGGHLVVLKWLLYSIGCEIDSISALNRAIDGGHLEVVDYLLQLGPNLGDWRKCPDPISDYDNGIMRAAAARGCTQIADLLYEVKFPIDSRAFGIAASNGHMEMIKWLYEKKPKMLFGSDICAGAALSGSLEILQWARRKNCFWGFKICNNAAYGGHLELLQWARENGCGWNETTCSGAATGGHLYILKWARENGCPWDDSVCSGAAGRGYLKILKWARENGCPWSSVAIEYAIMGGYLKTLKWLLVNGCPRDDDNQIIAWCFKWGRKKLAKWFLDHRDRNDGRFFH